MNQSKPASGECRAGAVQGAFLALLSILSVAAALLIAPILPRMTEHFASVPNAQGLVILSLTIPALVVAITSPFAGMLIDGMSRKWVLVVSLLLYGFCGLAPFALDDLGADHHLPRRRRPRRGRRHDSKHDTAWRLFPR